MVEVNSRCQFLAATSSSRSDGVTQSVCPFVCPLFLSLVSLKFVVHLERHKVSKSVKGIQRASIYVSRVFQVFFKGVSMVFLWVFQGSLKGVLKVFQGSFKSVSRKF